MTGPTRATPAGRAYRDLQNVARRQGRTTQELLTMYVVERWLARLSRSAYSGDFVLKGGMLLAAYGYRRPTVDADAWARNLSSEPTVVGRRVAEIAVLEDPDDGVAFEAGSVTAQVIRQDAVYTGVRVTMGASLATAAVTLRLDVSFGDPITPRPGFVEVPALRPDMPAVRVLGYPIATVLAEKIVTAIDLGPANTRVRDYADIASLLAGGAPNEDVVRAAVRATAAFRGVVLRPLSGAVADLVLLRSSAYDAYRRGLGAAGAGLPRTFGEVVGVVADYVDRLLADG
jgi:hypothetical protein